MYGLKTIKEKNIGSILLLIASLFWGMNFVVLRLAAQNTDTYSFTAARMAVSAIVMAFFMVFTRKQYKDKDIRITVWAGILCGLLMVLVSLSMNFGLGYVIAGKGAFLSSTYLFFIPFVSRFFLKKSVCLRVWLAVMIGILGMLCMFYSGDISFGIGEFYLLISGIAYTGYILIVEKYVKDANPVAMLAIQSIICSAIAAVMAFITTGFDSEGIRSSMIAVLYSGVLSGGIGYMIQFIAQRFVTPSETGVIISSEAVWSTLFGYLILKETLKINEAIGAVIMLIAVVLINTQKNEKTKEI